MNPDRLNDIVEPAAVSWMPQTIGWAALTLVVTLLLLGFAWTRYRAWTAAAYRREALAELAGLRETALVGANDDGAHGVAAALAALPTLVKRVVLTTSDRTTVAALSGTTWLEYLDRSYTRPAFTNGPGRLLPDLSYASSEQLARHSAADVDALFALLEDWIGTHRIPEASPGAGRR